MKNDKNTPTPATLATLATQARFIVVQQSNDQAANDNGTDLDDDEQEAYEERAAILQYDGDMTREEAETTVPALSAAGAVLPVSAITTAHPTPPLPDNYRWQGIGPLHTLDADPGDQRRRCAYCANFQPQTRDGRLKPWCVAFDEWRDPSILHHCDQFQLEAGAVGRWCEPLPVTDESR